MVDFKSALETDRAIRRRIQAIQEKHPHTDLVMATRRALRDSVKEIADLERQRDALQESQKRLAELVQEAANNVWSYDNGCPFCWVTDDETGTHRDDCPGLAALKQLEGE